MKRATSDSSRRSVPAPSRHRLLPEARRLLWSLLRARARGPRQALRQRLHTFLRAASSGTLLRLVRQAAVAGAVALALATSATAAETIDLADVTEGRGGFVVEGHGTRTAAGIGATVANAGDVNGDGIPDVIVGGRDCRSDGPYSYAGCSTVPSYVVFGRRDGAPATLEDVAAGWGGFVIRGLELDYDPGSSVSGAGDVDGDGLADVIVGFSRYAGTSYVVFGKTTTEPVELADVAAGNGGFVIRGADDDGSGFSVSGAGDMDGDGLADVVIGAPWVGRTQDEGGGFYSPGASYVVFGKATTEPVELAQVAEGNGGFVIRGDGSDAAGWSVSGAGDVDGDGVGDLLIGAPSARGERQGAAYIVFGKADREAVMLAEVAAGTGGFVLRGLEAQAVLGWSVSGAGDVDGDGLADVIVGAPGSSSHGGDGKCYVVFGKPTTEAVELSDVVAGARGFLLRGAAGTGDSVSGAGDVDGDGLPDLVIGSPSDSSTFVVFGKPTTEPVELADVAAGEGGFVIRGESPAAVAGGVDRHGDGHADVLVGAPDTHDGLGTLYTVFGKVTGEAVELADVEAGDGGHALHGFAGRDYSSLSVSEAGDVNGDGFTDVVIGAPFSYDGAGATFVVFGKETTEPVDLAEIAAGRGGFVIRAESEGDRSGWSVSGAGDVNGDGLADLIVGAPGSRYYAGDYDRPGSSYVIFGKSTTEPVDLAKVAVGEGGFVIRGKRRDELGFRVAGAGDVDGDGLSDVVVRTRGQPGGFPYPRDPDIPGASYVIFGKARGETVSLWDVDRGTGGFVIRDDELLDDDYYWSAAGAGDVNGDGHADIVIGAPTIDPRGASYVVFGKATPENITLADVAAGDGGFVIRGESEGDRSGRSVSAAGDVNGDGIADLCIGAPGSDVWAGATYVVFGKETSETVELSAVAAGGGGFVIRGENTGDQSGASVSTAGDVDGDGLADVLIGAPSAEPGGREGAGASYVVFGKNTTEAVELGEVSGGTGGFAINGERTGDRSGARVSGGSDINGDGVPDVVMGNARRGLDGTVHVVFGPLREGVPRFRRGEVNGDGQVDISDGISTLSYLFLGEKPPACLDAVDANDDGQIDISDGIATLGYLFVGSARPPVPGPTHCGIDPTDDALECENLPGDCR